MQLSKRKGLDNFVRIKQKELYEVYSLETSPEIEIEVYRLDYVKKKDRDLYEYRMKNPHPYLPQILNVDYPETTNFIYTQVVLEHTPVRLEESETTRYIPKKSLDLLIMEALIGFETVFKKFGAFRVKSNMIGFGREGNCKVWINSNFAKNHFNPFEHSVSDSEASMVKSIYDIFREFGYTNIDITEAETFEQARKLTAQKMHDREAYRVMTTSEWTSHGLPSTPKRKRGQNSLGFGDTVESSFRPSMDFQGYSNKPSLHQIRVIGKEQDEDQDFLSFLDKEQKKHTGLSTRLEIDKSFTDMLGEDFLVIKRKSYGSQTMAFTDQAAVIDYLGSSSNMVNKKLLFINKLKQKSLTSKIKEIVAIFQYALTKDPDLYSALLRHKGNYESITQPETKVKISIIKSTMCPTMPIKQNRPVRVVESQVEILVMPAMTESQTRLVQQPQNPRKNIHVNHSQPRQMLKTPALKQGSRMFATKSDLIQTPGQRAMASHVNQQSRSNNVETFDTFSTRPMASKIDAPLPRSYQKPIQQQMRQPARTYLNSLLSNKGSPVVNKTCPALKEEVLRLLGKQ